MGVDMTIEPGGIHCFCRAVRLWQVYPSAHGCRGWRPSLTGKSRLVRRVINDVSPADRDVAMVFQNYALYPHMSVRGNMSYGLKNRGLPKQQIDEKVNEAAKMLRIADFLDRQPQQLSGGTETKGCDGSGDRARTQGFPI